MEKMRKRGRGCPRSTSNDDAEFFKIFIPCRNSQQLKIPPDFVRKFGGTMHKKTTLEAHDGKLWKVDIEHTDEGFFMKKGWFNYVNHYSLREGQFLVFQYIRCSTFVVKIFGTNGCKIGIAREVKIEDQESEENEVKKSSERPSSSSKRPRGSKKPQKVSSRLVKQEHVVTAEDPYFIKPVNYNQRYQLIIPREIFTVHKVGVRSDVVLRNEKGETWPVKMYKCADRAVFGSGWMKFWQQNNVQSCDACKFTFLKGGSSNVIQVEIMRSQAK